MASKTQSPDHVHATMTENPQEMQPRQVREETPCPDQANSGIVENFMARMTEFFWTSTGTQRADEYLQRGLLKCWNDF